MRSTIADSLDWEIESDPEATASQPHGDPNKAVRGSPLSVFQTRAGGRNVRLVARPRAGLRHEITSVEPERAARADLYGELGKARAVPEPAKTQVSFTPLPPPRSYWPVQTRHPSARVVSYRTTTGTIVGSPGRRFMASRKGERDGVRTARNHAGVDLFARVGDPVIACENGTITDFSFFYNAKSGQRTCKILVEHSGAVINYGEVAPDSFTRTRLKPGLSVRAGQVIGFVSDTGMLHFETYAPGTKTSFRWWTGDSPPPRLLDPTRYLLHLARHDVSAPRNVPGAPSTAASPPGARKPSKRQRPAPLGAADREVAHARRIARREVSGMPGTTMEGLIEPWRLRICPEVPRWVLLAFITLEAGKLFDDATHGKRGNRWTSPPFYELGIFQTPAGLHGACTSDDWKDCEIKPPGRERPSASPWARLCARIGANSDDWRNPATQVRVGLQDLEDGANALRKAYPDLFPNRGSDWDLRMAVLYRFSRGGGYARSFLTPYRPQLVMLPEEQRWTFLRDKTARIRKKGKKDVQRTFKGGNVEDKMALAAKLGYRPAEARS
jgi:murein DD-endopeptidase MepM/ murein hydrolase activator NlpD